MTMLIACVMVMPDGKQTSKKFNLTNFKRNGNNNYLIFPGTKMCFVISIMVDSITATVDTISADGGKLSTLT